jgi:hypothetical protein
MHVEAQEVDDFARRVDLGLEDGLALPQHGRGIEPLPPRARQQIGGAKEHRRAILEPPPAPVSLGPAGRGDRVPDRPPVGLMGGPQVLAVPVRRYHLHRLAAPDILAVDHRGNVGDRCSHGLELGLERRTLRTPRRIVEDRLVAGRRNIRSSSHEGTL